MRVLLVNPNREQMPWPVVPVGLCLVATATERAGHDVRLLDLTFSRAPARELEGVARRFAPDVIGLGVRNIDNCNFERPVFYLDELRDEIVPAARRGAPSARLVLGGAGLNVAPRQVLDYLGADCALVGEGELTLPALLAALGGGATLQQLELPGLVTRSRLPARASSDERLAAPSRLASFEGLPSSEAYRWVGLRRYRGRGTAYPVQSKRGCAQRCSYCVYNAIEGRAYRLRVPAALVDEVAEAHARAGVRRFELVDSTFNLPLDHALAVCEAFAARALPVRLTTMGLNPATVTPELTAAMQRAGFDSVMCSAESASNVTLASLGKGYDRDAVLRAAEQLRRARLRTFWYFIFGAPGETLATVEETLAFCERHISPDDVVLLTTGIRVYDGTELARRLRAEGWFAADDPLLLPSWYVSPEIDLAALYQRLVAAAEAHPGWMTNAETILAPRLARLMKGAFELIGWRGPFWTHLPRFFALSGRVGARGRVLRDNLTRVMAIEDIAHHPQRGRRPPETGA